MMIFGHISDFELFSAELAEPLYNFVYDKCLDDYLVRNELERMSLAQYVFIYKKAEFAAYLAENGYIQELKPQN